MAIETERTTRTAYHGAGAALGISIALTLPVAVAVAGIVRLGWGAIEWEAAIVGGLVGTWAFSLLDLLAARSRLTRADLLDLLGSAIAPPGSRASRGLGLVMNSINGALLAIAWAYGVRLAGGTPSWSTGLLGGILLWAVALLALSCAGAVHPAMRRGAQVDPGPLALELGQLAPLVSLVGHAAFGIALGLIYAAWPA